MLDLYEVTGEEREYLLGLTEEARGLSGWHQYRLVAVRDVDL